MTTTNHSRKPWSAREMAFIIGYTNLCIDRKLDYPAMVVEGLLALSSRTVAWDTIRGKLERSLKSYGMSKPSVSELRERVIGYLDLEVLPAYVRSELHGLRQEWGLPPLHLGNNNSAYPVANTLHAVVDEDRTSNTEEQLEPRVDVPRRSETLQVENTPEIQPSNIPTIDGAAERPTMSPFTPTRNTAADCLSSPEYDSSPLASPKQHMKKRRAPTPEDRDDDDYAPSSKRKKSTGSSSVRVARNEAKCTRGTTLPKSSANVHAKNGATTQGSPNIQTSIEPYTRVPDIIVIDDTPEELPAVSSSSRSVERNTPSSDSSRPSLGQAANKRKADSESERSASALEPDPKRQRRNDLTLEAVNLKVDALSSILSSWMTRHSHTPEDFVEQCYSILRTVNGPKGSVIGNLLKDLESQRALKARYRDMVKKIVKYVDPITGTAFPREPAHREIEQIWKKFQEYVVSIVGYNNFSPEISISGAGYLTCCAENISYGRIPGKEIGACIESLGEYLKSPHAQQALFSALFCHWLFATPERMLDAMHSDGMMTHYKSVFDTADTKAIGLATIQQQDKVAAKLMFEDPDFIDTKYKYRTSDIKERFQAMREKLCQESSIPPSMTPSEFAKEAVDLKQNLLLSPKEYRIHYIRPGTKFDASLMQAIHCEHYPVSDAMAADKNVSLCLYPLLLTLEPEPIKEDTEIEEMLCKNERFMPNFEEISRGRVPGSQVSKAVVLLVEE